MNCFHAIMSIKPKFDLHLNKCVHSFAAVEIASVIEYIQKEPVKGIPGIYCKSINMFDLQENTRLIFSVFVRIFSMQKQLCLSSKEKKDCHATILHIHKCV